MAYAVLAGLPAIYGLYVSMVPLVLYAIFGTSRQLSVGPVAIVSLQVFAGVGEIAEVGSKAIYTAGYHDSAGSENISAVDGVTQNGIFGQLSLASGFKCFTSTAALTIRIKIVWLLML